jgi:hypothetical protein
VRSAVFVSHKSQPELPKGTKFSFPQNSTTII